MVIKLSARSQQGGVDCSVSKEEFQNGLAYQKDLADPDRDTILPTTKGVTILFISPDHAGARNYPSTSFTELMPP